METKDRIEQFIKEFLKDRIVKKNLCNGTWLSGSSTTVHPVTIWKDKVVFQWNSDRRVFDKFIKKTVEQYSDLFKDGYFWKSDGSCPSTITFVLKESLRNRNFNRKIEVDVMPKYRCYDWNGNLICSEISELKEAVRQALKNGCEVHDENGDIIFSQWDGWNSDYPNIKNICFPVADMKMIDAEDFPEWLREL